MKRYLFIILLVGISHGQTIAVTSEGKIVNLNDDGTWSYQKDKERGDIPSESIWTTEYFVDDFGDPTNDGYINTFLEGKFSNSATTNSSLGVKFIITNEKVSIKLYEYNRNHAVSGQIATKSYDIALKHNGTRVKSFYGNNYSDRVTLEDKDSKRLISLFKKGGNFNFKIEEVGRYTSSIYKFEIPNASGFNEEWDKIISEEERERIERKKREDERAKRQKKEENQKQELIKNTKPIEVFNSKKFVIVVKQININGKSTFYAELENLTNRNYKSVWFTLNAKYTSDNSLYTERVSFKKVNSKSKSSFELHTGQELKDINFKFLKNKYF